MRTKPNIMSLLVLQRKSLVVEQEKKENKVHDFVSFMQKGQSFDILSDKINMSQSTKESTKVIINYKVRH
jgi:hypothetical protein